jgi:hypothetical protein
MCACAGLQILSHVETYPNGATKLSYQYYIGKDGKEVLHGKMERWDTDQLTGTESEYRDGVLVSRIRLIRNF